MRRNVSEKCPIKKQAEVLPIQWTVTAESFSNRASKARRDSEAVRSAEPEIAIFFIHGEGIAANGSDQNFGDDSEYWRN